MDKFIKHFIRGQSGWWECVSPAEIEGPNGRIQVTPGSRFFPGAPFMGVDLAKRLNAEHQRSRGADAPARVTGRNP